MRKERVKYLREISAEMQIPMKGLKKIYKGLGFIKFEKVVKQVREATNDRK